MERTFTKKNITKKSINISQWYQEVILHSGLADYSDVKGCMIFKPSGYAIWEKTQAIVDKWFKEDGVQNVYFPMFIPYDLLQREKEHLEGFSPELAVVDYAGGEKLTQPYVLRPTSETIMYATFPKWIQSYRDLPLKVNQWCNVVRWEKRTYLFLRTTEFLWQEGHTVHQTEPEAIDMALKALGWYKKFYEEYLAISVYIGIKSDTQKFAGAKTTYSVELVMPDGKALQGATSHNLADNFSRVFNIKFLDKDGSPQYPFQTSWAISTRAIGGLILTHGDDAGLILPPKIAPLQIVMVEVADNNQKAQGKIDRYAHHIYTQLREKNFSVILDNNTHHSLGYRINEWELKGIPLRLEVGSKEVREKTITLARRDTFAKKTIHEKDLLSSVIDTLDAIQNDLRKKSEATKKELTIEVNDYKEFKENLRKKKVFIRAFWCENTACEKHIKDETKATTRVLELDELHKNHEGGCIYCNKKTSHRWLFAQSY